ncbi:GDP-fucose protein O-fucosyltransferase 2-like [Hyalella azteca]|uniref:GDP-fucose protein O-fucosyltransferase 2-like n=1 Tax=Hyalella azteca TaxID=294128 RepID=A0A979FQA9_HYAAZ|nr:GDP-fucose protein O-fucosyltransferase 2-like [Hyalella azteca]
MFMKGNNHHLKEMKAMGKPEYLLYSVNIGEGFNLRRDVYLRFATFVHSLNAKTRIHSMRSGFWFCHHGTTYIIGSTAAVLPLQPGVAFTRGETVLHDNFGDRNWRCRRSMRVAADLVMAATTYRRTKLNSTNERDQVTLASDWTQHTK